MVNPTPVPSNIPRPQSVAPSSSPALPSTNTGNGTPRIKEEPQYPNHGLPTNGLNQYGSGLAKERAAQNLMQKYGPDANVQINQLRAQAALSGPGQQAPQQNLQNIQLPPQSQMSDQQRRAYLDQHRRQMMQNMQQHGHPSPKPDQKVPVSNAQTDGVAEWDGMVAQRRALVSADPEAAVAADLTIRQRLEESSRAMEGGGLMLPLSEHPKSSTVNARDSATSQHLAAQFDGPGDSDEDRKDIKTEKWTDEDDEDAINSDLDDPDEEDVEEVGEDSNQGQIMLCTYDKVQRVKAKWKCILKDGVLTTGGKE